MFCIVAIHGVRPFQNIRVLQRSSRATYTFCKSLAIDDAIFDFEGGSTYYYKKAGVIVATYCGEIKCTDAQLVKVLTDDYKHRLIKTLSKVSDDSICEYYENEVAKYKMRNK